MQLGIDLSEIKGFLDPDEGAALFNAARAVASLGPCLEIGSYCGKSAVYLGKAIEEAGGVLFAVDHHRGSEENQPGWPYHDESLWDEEVGALDTLPSFRRTLRQAKLENSVIPIVGRSDIIARHWQTSLSFLFIDGGHTLEHALSDYRGWAPHVMRGGILAVHDVFPDPNDGGQAPFEVYSLAKASGLFEEIDLIKSLALLRRL